jgi:hypothetical protein
LTAFFHPEIKEGRRLTGEKATNQVVVDFDLAKLGSKTPSDAAVDDAVKLICSMLDTVECGHSASFKLDESGDAKKVKKPDPVWPVFLGLAGLAALVLTCATFLLAKQFMKSSVEPKTVFVTPKAAEEPVEEKKPRVIEDDNVSTATPVSLPDSLPSVDENKAEQVV